jgi:hypothetical protein
MHSAFQYLAMLIHLAQFALRIDFVPAVYQQVVHNQPAARSNAETVLRDRRRCHKPTCIQAFKESIAYAFRQINATLCCKGIFQFAANGRVHASPVAPGRQLLKKRAKGSVRNNTAGVKPAVLLARLDT